MFKLEKTKTFFRKEHDSWIVIVMEYVHHFVHKINLFLMGEIKSFIFSNITHPY